MVMWLSIWLLLVVAQVGWLMAVGVARVALETVTPAKVLVGAAVQKPH